ncbi:nuclear transport factor 2 family protein [Gordonia sp. TBRC 11910]|uniref:Nuclear transport factor 2 family protein n=1 Tax=Gordonia asplenii TaxID=2725283 RepID=A0A848KWS5_9ACTN|nr:nuclear transport factor 2 family protein [Gordonia asplenii]NMO02517.1 nuclear transport factor 2 family protein [Gordonia asplenii]
MTDSLYADIAAIKANKYRYLRALDTKDWDTFSDTLTEDATGNYGELNLTSRSEIVAFMRKNMGPRMVSEHRVAHPEIDVDGDTATGRWYLQDKVIVAEMNFMLVGAAFYADTYRRTDDGWRISSTGYDRTYELSVPLNELPGFNLKVGPAVRL